MVFITNFQQNTHFSLSNEVLVLSGQKNSSVFSIFNVDLFFFRIFESTNAISCSNI